MRRLLILILKVTSYLVRGVGVLVILFFAAIYVRNIYCDLRDTQSLGSGYVYNKKLEKIEYHDCMLKFGYYDLAVPHNVLNFKYDSRFIVAKQIPGNASAMVKDKDYLEFFIYERGLDSTYYWIVDKAKKSVYGPMELSSFKEQADSLGVNRQLQSLKD